MLMAWGMLSIGIGIMFLMLIELLPLSFVLGFLAFGLAFTGGVLAFACCGEIS